MQMKTFKIMIPTATLTQPTGSTYVASFITGYAVKRMP